MGEDLLSLKWNNHKPSFSHLLKLLREKGCYSDVTLACGSKFFSVHRLVLMACSEFFTEVFDHTQCQKPVIVLKDIKGQELEALLDYMYLGEVDVQRTDLPGLIKAAECLRIKGLAVPDEDPTQPQKIDAPKSGERSVKRRRQEREVKDCDRGNVGSHSSDRLELRGLHSSQTGSVSHYSHQRTDVEIIQGGDELTANTITVSHAGGETHLISHDPSLIHVQQEQTLSPSRTQSLDARLEHDSHLHHDASQGHLTESKHVEGFADCGPEIKVEHCDLEEEIENNPLKSEVTEIHSDPLTDSGAGGGEFTHFMTVEENLAHHMFQQAPQAGPSGLHRQQGREGGSEVAGDDGSLNRSGVGGSLYPSHLLGETTTETATIGVANQSGLVMTEGPVVRDEQGRLCYRCLYCQRIDSDKSKWRRHLRTHTGEKPYHCTKCPYRATTRHAVVRHDKFRHSLESYNNSGGIGISVGLRAEEKP